MPKIKHATRSRLDKFTEPTALSIGTSKPSGAPIPLSVKMTSTTATAPRIDLELTYTQLKTALGENWTEYKEAVTLFTLGRLNQNELSSRIDHLLRPNPVIANYHNRIIVGIYVNAVRDLPDHGVAPWVSADDKPVLLDKPVVLDEPVVLDKPVTGDAAEQVEDMNLTARDRRRLNWAAREREREKEERERVKEEPEHGVTVPVTKVSYLAKKLNLEGIAPPGAGGLKRGALTNLLKEDKINN